MPGFKPDEAGEAGEANRSHAHGEAGEAGEANRSHAHGRTNERAQPPSPQKTASRNRILLYGTLLLLMGVYIHSFFTRQLIAVTAVDLREAFQLSNLQIGLLYGSFFSVIYAIAGIPMGRLTDRTSRKWMILIGLTLWSLATLLTGFATTFIALILFRILLGLSQAMLSPAVYSFLTDYAPEKDRATAFSIYAAGIFIGVGLSFLIGGEIAQTTSWQQAFKGGGLMGFLLVPILLIVLKEPAHQSRIYSSGILAETRNILSIQSVRWHLLGFSALACTGYTVLAFAGVLLTDPFSSTSGTSAPVVQHFGWFVLAVSLTVILSGILADRAARKDPALRYNAGTFAALAGLPLYAAGFFSKSPLAALMFMGFGVLISSSYNGVAAALIQSYVGEGQRALTGGIYLFVISIAGFGFGPPAAGFLMDHLYTGAHASGKAVFTVMICCSILASYAFQKVKLTHQSDMHPS